MIERPTAWPDGRPLGGVNGYSPEWYAWAQECEVRFVAKQMLAVPGEQRKAVHEQWVKVFPHATPEKIKTVWDQVVDELKRNTKGNKTQQLRNNATRTQQRTNRGQ